MSASATWRTRDSLSLCRSAASPSLSQTTLRQTHIILHTPASPHWVSASAYVCAYESHPACVGCLPALLPCIPECVRVHTHVCKQDRPRRESPAFAVQMMINPQRRNQRPVFAQGGRRSHTSGKRGSQAWAKLLLIWVWSCDRLDKSSFDVRCVVPDGPQTADPLGFFMTSPSPFATEGNCCSAYVAVSGHCIFKKYIYFVIVTGTVYWNHTSAKTKNKLYNEQLQIYECIFVFLLINAKHKWKRQWEKCCLCPFATSFTVLGHRAVNKHELKDSCHIFLFIFLFVR